MLSAVAAGGSGGGAVVGLPRQRRLVSSPDRRLQPCQAERVAVRGAEPLRRAAPRAVRAVRRCPPHVGLRYRQARQRQPPRWRAHRDQSRRTPSVQK